MPLWVDASESAGAIAAAVALLGGVAISVFYGRKANVGVQGTLHEFPDGRLVMAARVSVGAVGVYRIRFSEAVVRVTELDAELTDGYYWDQERALKDSFVDGGETLTTTCVIPLGAPSNEVVGWRVSFGISTKRLLRNHSWAWVDRVFVARPLPLAGERREDEDGVNDGESGAEPTTATTKG